MDKRASAIGSGDKAAVPCFGHLHNSCSSRDNAIPIRTAAPAPVDQGRHTFNQRLLPGSAQPPIPYLQAASLSERPVSQGARPGYAEPRHQITTTLISSTKPQSRKLSRPDELGAARSDEGYNIWFIRSALHIPNAFSKPLRTRKRLFVYDNRKGRAEALPPRGVRSGGSSSRNLSLMDYLRTSTRR